MYTVYKQIINDLENNREIVLATIVEKVGSGPREIGAKMIVYKDGSIFGTIGGGALELKSINKAESVFETKENQIINYSLKENHEDSIGMICGGNVKVYLEYLSN